MIDFHPRDSFGKYQAILLARFYEKVRALKAGNIASFAFIVWAPDEFEADACAFIQHFNTLHLGSYTATIYNDDGVLLITVASRRSLFKRLLRQFLPLGKAEIAT